MNKNVTFFIPCSSCRKREKSPHCKEARHVDGFLFSEVCGHCWSLTKSPACPVKKHVDGRRMLVIDGPIVEVPCKFCRSPTKSKQCTIYSHSDGQLVAIVEAKPDLLNVIGSGYNNNNRNSFFPSTRHAEAQTLRQDPPAEKRKFQHDELDHSNKRFVVEQIDRHLRDPASQSSSADKKEEGAGADRGRYNPAGKERFYTARNKEPDHSDRKSDTRGSENSWQKQRGTTRCPSPPPRREVARRHDLDSHHPAYYSKPTATGALSTAKKDVRSSEYVVQSERSAVIATVVSTGPIVVQAAVVSSDDEMPPLTAVTPTGYRSSDTQKREGLDRIVYEKVPARKPRPPVSTPSCCPGLDSNPFIVAQENEKTRVMRLVEPPQQRSSVGTTSATGVMNPIGSFGGGQSSEGDDTTSELHVLSESDEDYLPPLQRATISAPFSTATGRSNDGGVDSSGRGSVSSGLALDWCSKTSEPRTDHVDSALGKSQKYVDMSRIAAVVDAVPVGRTTGGAAVLNGGSSAVLRCGSSSNSSVPTEKMTPTSAVPTSGTSTSPTKIQITTVPTANTTTAFTSVPVDSAPDVAPTTGSATGPVPFFVNGQINSAYQAVAVQSVQPAQQQPSSSADVSLVDASQLTSVRTGSAFVGIEPMSTAAAPTADGTVRPSDTTNSGTAAVSSKPLPSKWQSSVLQFEKLKQQQAAQKTVPATTAASAPPTAPKVASTGPPLNLKVTTKWEDSVLQFERAKKEKYQQQIEDTLRRINGNLPPVVNQQPTGTVNKGVSNSCTGEVNKVAVAPVVTTTAPLVSIIKKCKNVNDVVALGRHSAQQVQQSQAVRSQQSAADAILSKNPQLRNKSTAGMSRSNKAGTKGKLPGGSTPQWTHSLVKWADLERDTALAVFHNYDNGESEDDLD